MEYSEQAESSKIKIFPIRLILTELRSPVHSHQRHVLKLYLGTRNRMIMKTGVLLWVMDYPDRAENESRAT